MPPKKLRGMEMTRAQGQETTRKFKARVNHIFQVPKPSTGGSTASTTAATTTAGVYTRAKRVMNCSLLAFLAEEFSTRSRMRATVDCP